MTRVPPILARAAAATIAAAGLVRRADAGAPLRASAPPRPATAPADTRPADVSLRDVDGAVGSPLACPPGAKAAVVFFLAHDCPISNAYAPEVNRICGQYGRPDRFGFAVVYPYADLSAADAKAHAKAFGYTVPAFVDVTGAVTRRAGARVTPEVAVIGPDGSILYRGRIDDRWAGYGRSRPEPTTRDLRDALDAILAGKPVPVGRTAAVGCRI